MNNQLKREIIDIKAECFIIPNGAGPLSSFMKSSHDDLRKIVELNDLDPDDQSHLFVQIWLTNTDELASENLIRHSFSIKNWDCGFDGGEAEYVPHKIFENVKEGGKTKIRLPGWKRVGNQATNVIWDITVTCVQNKYRYRDYGPFENCLKAVC